MLTLLHRFAALTLTLAVLSWLLPEGSVRRTAMLAAGLMAALCFLEGVQGLLQLPEAPVAPATVLTETSARAGDLSAAMDVYERQAEQSGAGMESR